jgi:hypothetical protein
LLADADDAPRRVGLIGLGIGTLAAYGRPGDHFHFIEIDPKIVEVARREFDFLGASQANLTVAVGDGRIVLEQLTNQFDALVVDAFSGDVVPAHLLTAEALDLYLARLTPAGVLALHLSNTHLDLTPVVNHHARQRKLYLHYIDSPADGEHPRSLWALLSRRPLTIPPTTDSDAVSRRELRWTDQQHSLLPLLRVPRPWSSTTGRSAPDFGAASNDE